MKKYRILVKGMVQGVGYRYYCKRKAEVYGIKGFVRNLFNGDVELEVEGNQNVITDFIKELKTGPGGAYVKSVIIEDSLITDSFSEFRIH